MKEMDIANSNNFQSRISNHTRQGRPLAQGSQTAHWWSLVAPSFPQDKECRNRRESRATLIAKTLSVAQVKVYEDK